MSTPIRFGTDGWRALMDSDFTHENVERLIQALSDYLNSKPAVNGGRRVVVGYDWRNDSENFAETVTSVLLGNNIQVVLSTRAVPTPAVSYAVVKDKFDLGVAVTASHNPGTYNGIKIKDKDGSSADPEITKAIESFLDKNEVKKNKVDMQDYQKDIFLDYIQFFKSYLNLKKIQNSSFKILVDSMHGIGATQAENILAGGAINIKTIRGNRDTTFGGHAPEPILKNMSDACEIMKGNEYHVAFGTDGDADRIGAIRPGGEFVMAGTLLSLILIHFVEDLKKTGAVVTTLSNTQLIHKVANDLGLKSHETPVGFKHLVEVMRKEDVLIAGEESGGIAFQGYLLERDGVMSALLIMQMMAYRNQSFEDLLKSVEEKYGKFLYLRNDIQLTDESRDAFVQKINELNPDSVEGLKVLSKNTMDGVKFVLERDSWILFRLSGTEPLLRIYAESPIPGFTESLLEWGKGLTQGV